LYTLRNHTKIRPHYTSRKGWNSDISDISNRSELPPEAKHLLSFIEEALSTKITMISTGPERDSLITGQ
jgi:adenylosuccinate synthase